MTIAQPCAREAAGPVEATSAERRFAAAYRELFDPLYRYVRFRVGDPHVAEDLTAAVFERALRKLATVEQPDRLRPWLFTIARRAVADEFRTRRPTADLDRVDERADLRVDSPEEGAERREEVRRLLVSLAELPEREREVLGLRYVGELSHREIARVLGLSEANVAQITHRARAKLRQRFDEEIAP